MAFVVKLVQLRVNILHISYCVGSYMDWNYLVDLKNCGEFA